MRGLRGRKCSGYLDIRVSKTPSGTSLRRRSASCDETASPATTRRTVRASVSGVRIAAPEAGRPRLALRAGFLLAALLASVTQPVAAEPASSAVESKATATSEEASLFALPTTFDHIGRVVVPAMVNGKGPFRFIVDTGATYSTVSPGLVRALGLKPANVPGIVVNGITGTAQVSAVTIDTLQTGDLIVDGLVAPVVWAPAPVVVDI